MSILQIYRASAGSGKTYMLTNRYLELAFKHPDKFSNILAVTFTNKAAEEMKTRIINEVYNISRLGHEAPHYQTIHENNPQLNEQQTVELAKHVLTNILHNYSLFSVSTIDSFVQRVVRSFAYEIGIQAGYKIELDTNKVISELNELLYDKLLTDKELLDWLVRFAYYRIDEGYSWDFRSELNSLAREVFKEKFLVYAENHQEKQSKQLLTELYKELQQIRISFENKMKQYSFEAQKCIEKAGINIQMLGRNFKTISSYLILKINNPGSTAAYEPSVTVLNAVDSFEKWYAKKASAEIISSVRSVFPVLNTILNNVLLLFNSDFEKYSSAIISLNNFHAFGILDDLTRILPEYREQNNLLLISDTTVLLRQIIANNEAPFIFEKTGTRFQHILIDEFQDTSGFQWENFKPLIKNALSEGNTNLIVGDIKQSIYRWRNGDWKLLLQQVEKDIGKNSVSSKSLDTNWRSRENIIDFNNALFAALPSLLQQVYNNELEEGSNRQTRKTLSENGYNSLITNAYTDTFQEYPKKDREGGNVSVEFIKTKDRRSIAKKWKEEANERLPKIIELLITEKEYKPGDITILVRKNREGSEIVDLLLEYMHSAPNACQYDIISSESLFISNSKSVRVLISALKFVSDQRDNISLAGLVNQYLDISGYPNPDLHHAFTATNAKTLSGFLPAEFTNALDILRKLPVYELCERLVYIFGLSDLTGELPYIQAFQDAVLDFCRNENSDLNDFLEWWAKENNKFSVQLSESQDAVRIMTIHKSKGLAFKVVLIPYCDWQLDHNHLISNIIWCQPKEPPFNTVSFLPVKYQKKLAKTVYQVDYFDEMLYAYMDALNMLYVAFTRAVEELIVIAPADDSGKTAYISDLLYLILNGKFVEKSQEKNSAPVLPDYYSGEFCKFELTSEFLTENKPTESQDETTSGSIQISTYPFNNWRKKISVRNNSSEFFIESVESIEERVNYGTLMHRILSKIYTKNDIDEALWEQYSYGQITSAQKDELKNRITEIISRPEVREWFSPRWEIHTEAALLTPQGKIRIPDRILINDSKTVVIDFKFGEINEAHTGQINEYMQLLKEMGFPGVEGYLYYADLNKVIGN